ncbi:MAG: polysaccharide export outer membrane protein [Rhodocyclaceae bacterium]|nr:MAG: polysaccharide export outer membrane protein [Rhodocyclaceae bacterium]
MSAAARRLASPRTPTLHDAEAQLPMSTMRQTIKAVLLALLLALLGNAGAQEKQADYQLGPGDAIRIGVFQNPELSLESRVSESGTITYPLIGAVAIGGLSIGAAEQTIAAGLKAGGFVKEPQVNIMLVQIRGSQVSVLGQVGRPGRFPLETANTRVTEMLATAGGIAPGGADTLILTGIRNGKPLRMEIDVPAMLMNGNSRDDIVVQGGDIIYVHRAPQFYIHGEVQRPGSYRLERDMTLRHALAHSGGISLRGTERGIRIHRREADGRIAIVEPEQDDTIKTDDIIHVREALF